MEIKRSADALAQARADNISPEAAGSLPGLFAERVRRSPHAIAYREFDRATEQWRDFAWHELERRVGEASAALAAAGLQPGDRVAIALPNGVDWVTFDLAALSLGAVVVPLYLHDSAANMAFILADSGARVLIVDLGSRWAALAAHHGQLAQLEQVWINAQPAAVEGRSRPTVRAFAEVLAAPAPPMAGHRVEPDALATIVYTSGTTGRAKGVVLSHRAVLWNAHAVMRLIPPRPEDVFLSCLPLAHAFERTIGYYLPMMAGCTVAYARSIETLAADLRAQHPTVLLAVPRLYERACGAVRAKAGRNPLKRALLNRAVTLGRAQFEASQGRGENFGWLQRRAWRWLDGLVGAQVRAAFGGRLRVAVSGGAPLPLDIGEFLNGLGVPLVEGYGLTEAGPVVATNTLEDNVPGSVGRPLEGVAVQLSQGGELLVRSPSLMQGYWRADDLTQAAVDRGWLHTGDLAEIRAGRLYLTGRSKDLLVLPTGKKVSPGQIEAAIAQDPLVAHVLVIGDNRPFLAAVVALEKAGWNELAAQLAIPPGAPNHRVAREAVLRRVGERLKQQPRYAKVRAVHLTLDAWTVENGLLTPTLKTRRPLLEAKYSRDIAALYAATATSRTASTSA